MTRVLLLGGTAEGRALAKELHPHVEIVSSLAGRVPNPALPIGPVRIAGSAVSRGCAVGCERSASMPSSTPPTPSR